MPSSIAALDTQIINEEIYFYKFIHIENVDIKSSGKSDIHLNHGDGIDTFYHLDTNLFLYGYYQKIGKNGVDHISLGTDSLSTGLVGYGKVDTNYFEIRSYSDTVSIFVMLRYDNEGVQEEYEYNDSISQLPSAGLDLCGTPSCQNAEVIVGILIPKDVVSFLDNRAKGSMTNPYLELLNILFTIPHALENSGINNLRVHFDLFLLDTFPRSELPKPRDRINADVTTVREDYDSLRNNRRVDIMCFLTTHQYGDISGSVGNINVNEQRPSLVANIITSRSNRYTLAHEFGHIFGARHNRKANNYNIAGDDHESCSHAWRFTSGQESRTLLAFAGDKQRILQYSNPLLNYKQWATGTPDDNNSLTISNGKCFIQNAQSTPRWQVLANTPVFDPCEESGTFQLNTNVIEGISGYGCCAPYTPTWTVMQYPQSGLMTYNANGLQVNGSYSCQGGCIFKLKCEVLASCGGCVKEVIHTVEVIGNCLQKYSTYDVGHENISKPLDNRTSSSKLVLFPNPSADVIQILADETISEVEIYNSEGDIVSHVIDKRGISNIDISELPKGMYLVRSENSSGEISCNKIVKQ